MDKDISMVEHGLAPTMQLELRTLSGVPYRVPGTMFRDVQSFYVSVLKRKAVLVLLFFFCYLLSVVLRVTELCTLAPTFMFVGVAGIFWQLATLPTGLVTDSCGNCLDLHGCVAHEKSRR